MANPVCLHCGAAGPPATDSSSLLSRLIDAAFSTAFALPEAGRARASVARRPAVCPSCNCYWQPGTPEEYVAAELYRSRY